MPTIITFFVVLMILVLVHELGHFLAAKWAKMRVDEFAFGFPPRLWSVKKGETEYSFNLLPLGGYVKIYGENGDEEGVPPAGSFSAAPKWKQLIVLAAGVIMNLLLAIFIFFITYAIGVKTAVDPSKPSDFYHKEKEVVISYVMSNSPAEKAGIKPLDIVQSFAVEGQIYPQTFTPESFYEVVKNNQDKEITLTLSNKENPSFSRTVLPAEGIVADKKAIGVSLAELAVYNPPLHIAAKDAVVDTYKFTLLTFKGFYSLFAGLFLGGEEAKKAAESVTGPVGMFGLVKNAESDGVSSLLAFTALISINLAGVNILPLPALDGGRIVFVLIEMITRRKIPARFQNSVHGLSFILLLVLMIVITFTDIKKLF